MPSSTANDKELYRGTDQTVEWTLSGTSLATSVELTVACTGRTLQYASGTDPELVFSSSSQLLQWTPGPADSLAVPLGRVAQYEINYVAGGDLLPAGVIGCMIGLGGFAPST